MRLNRLLGCFGDGNSRMVDVPAVWCFAMASHKIRIPHFKLGNPFAAAIMAIWRAVPCVVVDKISMGARKFNFAKRAIPVKLKLY